MARYPAQMAILCESALGPPPTVKEFFDRIQAAQNQSPPTADKVLFGELFQNPKQARNSRRIQCTAVTAALDFQKVMDAGQCVIDNLDVWMLAFARWSVDSKLLFSADQVEEGLKNRAELCVKAGVPMRSWAPQTLKTNVNALANLYRLSQPVQGICPSIPKQFPRYCMFFNEIAEKSVAHRAIAQEVPVLSDSEVEHLYDRTNFSNPSENQRLNALLISYRLGQRPETLARLQVGNFRRIEDEEGQDGLEVIFGTMKNKRAKQETIGAAPHVQRIYAHANPKLCGVAAYNRQVQLLGQDGPSAGDFLFRTMYHFQRSAPQGRNDKKGVHYAMFRGVARWVSATLGRKVTFKDCARRPVATTLADCLPLHQAAKALGVHANTLGVYHRSASNVVANAAAEVLRGLVCPWVPTMFFFILVSVKEEGDEAEEKTLPSPEASKTKQAEGEEGEEGQTEPGGPKAGTTR